MVADRIDLNNRCWSCGHAAGNGIECCGHVYAERQSRIVYTKSAVYNSAVVRERQVYHKDDWWGEYVVELYQTGVLASEATYREIAHSDYKERALTSAKEWVGWYTK